MGAPPFATPILKVTESCNFKCSFCRYAKRDCPHGTMSLDVARMVIDEAVAFNRGNGLNSAHFVFHGGEPLLAGLEYFQSIIAYQGEILVHQPGFSITNSIQTNGFLLDADWMKVLYEGDFSIGVSIDGPDDLNSHYLTDALRAKSNQRVLENLQLANKLEVPIAVLSVITNDHVGRHEEFYRFLVDNDIHDVGLCPCYGNNEEDCVDPTGLASFLIGLFDCYFFGDYELRIREFESLIGRIMGARRRTCSACQREMCGCYPTIYPHGNVYFCDSLLDEERLKLGNLSHGSFHDLITSSQWHEAHEQARAGMHECATCELVKFCGSGCFRHDRPTGIAHEGKRTFFCETYRALIPHVQAALASVG